MDYPDECVLTNNRKNFFNENCKMDFPSENEFSSRLFYSDHRKLEENDDFSLGNSSAFSCDQDGYYTSMHMDSGINLRHTTSVSRLKPGSFAHPFGALNSSDDNDTSHSGSLTSSVNPSPATVMPVLEEDNTSQDDEANLPLCNLPPPNPDVFNLLVGGIDDSPPVSENHLASVDVHHQEDKLSRKTLKIGPAEIADDLLDDWLLQKFKLESSQCGSTTKSPVIISISPNETLPLSKAVHNCSIQAEKQFLTFPRKTVRFCD